MSLSIDQLCDEFQAQATTMTAHRVKMFCDNVVAQLNQQNESNNLAMLSKIVTHLNRIDKTHLNNSSIVGHSLFDRFRDTLVLTLRTGQKDLTAQQLCKEISDLFSEVTVKFVNLYVDIFKRLFMYKPLLDELSACLQSCAEDISKASKEYFKIFNDLLFAYECLMRRRVEIQEDALITTFLEAVAKCFTSPSYGQLLQHVGEQADLDPYQQFFFERCPFLLFQCRSQQRKHLLTKVRKVLLPLFNQHLPFKQINKGEMTVVSSICAILFIRAHDMLHSEKFRSQYEQLLHHLIARLSKAHEMPEKNDPIRIELIRETVEQLSNFIFVEYFVTEMRSHKLSSLLLKLIETIEDEALQFQAYRILAAILTEEDIKTLASPDKIVTIFFKQIHNILNDIPCPEPLDNVLIALKSLVQHDQVKDEIVKQQGVPLLFRCSIEPTLIERAESNHWSLEIMLALTFNKEAFNSIRTNSEFTGHLKTLLTSTDEEAKRAAERLLWKIEQEEKSVEKPTVQSNDKYDIMLSYSHSNKELCHYIHERLIQDGYRVWLDRDQMHGAPMVAMANAIENSEYVLLCMSDAYKQSPYCQLEAHYAFQRQCRLIPLVMTPRYRPDGWLGIITSGKIYVDFPKLKPEAAYLVLKKEIDEQRKSRTPVTETSHSSTTLSVPKVPTVIVEVRTEQTPTRVYPHCIDAWDNEHVRSFLIEKKLTGLLPITVEMNGRVLHAMYTMCKANPEAMFDRLKADTTKEQSLTMNNYLRFLDEIKQYVPISRGDQSSVTSVVCNLM